MSLLVLSLRNEDHVGSVKIWKSLVTSCVIQTSFGATGSIATCTAFKPTLRNNVALMQHSLPIFSRAVSHCRLWISCFLSVRAWQENSKHFVDNLLAYVHFPFRFCNDLHTYIHAYVVLEKSFCRESFTSYLWFVQSISVNFFRRESFTSYLWFTQSISVKRKNLYFPCFLNSERFAAIFEEGRFEFCLIFQLNLAIIYEILGK